MIQINDKNKWAETLAYFATLYAMQKVYSEYRTTESGLESASNVNHIAPAMSVGNTSINLNIGKTMGMPEYKATTSYNYYVERLEEFLADAKEYAGSINYTANDQTITELRVEIAAQYKKMYSSLQKIMTTMKAAIPSGGSPPENPHKTKKV